jgi:hypothetical protein
MGIAVLGSKGPAAAAGPFPLLQFAFLFIAPPVRQFLRQRWGTIRQPPQVAQAGGAPCGRCDCAEANGRLIRCHAVDLVELGPHWNTIARVEVLRVNLGIAAEQTIDHVVGRQTLRLQAGHLDRGHQLLDCQARIMLAPMTDIPTPSEDDLKYLRIDPTDEARVAWLKGMLKSAWYGGLAEGHR